MTIAFNAITVEGINHYQWNRHSYDLELSVASRMKMPLEDCDRNRTKLQDRVHQARLLWQTMLCAGQHVHRILADRILLPSDCGEWSSLVQNGFAYHTRFQHCCLDKYVVRRDLPVQVCLQTPS